jgi:hypothetical protein
MECHTWTMPSNLPKLSAAIAEDLFKNELEILSAKIEKGTIVISCTKGAYSGGELILAGESIEVFDQEWKVVHLIALINQYWKR